MKHRQEEGDYFRQLTSHVVFLTVTFLVCVKITKDDWRVCCVETGLIVLVQEYVLPGSYFSEWASSVWSYPFSLFTPEPSYPDFTSVIPKLRMTAPHI